MYLLFSTVAAVIKNRMYLFIQFSVFVIRKRILILLFLSGTAAIRKCLYLVSYFSVLFLSLESAHIYFTFSVSFSVIK